MLFAGIGDDCRSVDCVSLERRYAGGGRAAVWIYQVPFHAACGWLWMTSTATKLRLSAGRLRAWPVESELLQGAIVVGTACVNDSSVIVRWTPVGPRLSSVQCRVTSLLPVA